MSETYIPNFTPLDDEEKELEHLDPATALPESEKQAAVAAFRAASSGGVRKAVTMRLAESTINGLKARAEADGIPYQTLASMVLQKYVRGAFLEREAVQAVVTALK
jgi:predicted DNA binding CopG/RHH family protein